MPTIIACNHCGKSLKIPEHGLGKAVKCPLCRETFVAASAAAQAVTAVKPAAPAPPPLPVLIACPHCHRSLKTQRGNLGRTLKCPHCQAAFTAQLQEMNNNRDASRKSDTEQQARNVVSAPGERRAAQESTAFKALLTKDPRKKLKGQFQATLTDKGLLLKKSKKLEVFIPVGSDVRQTKGATLSLPIEDRVVECTVFSFILFRERLAHDVAEFLQRGGPFPRLSAYRMPWYLYAPAALPLLIPFITMGGAVPGAIGCGFAGSCVAVAQRERWPLAARLAAIWGLVLASYVSLFVALMFLGHSSQLKSATWQRFAPSGGRFTVEMPGTPSQETQRLPDAPIDMQIWKVIFSANDTGFFVHYFDLPPGLAGQLNFKKQILDAFPKARLEKEAQVDQGGQEFHLKLPGQVDIVRRCYLHNGRVYFVSVSSSRFSQVAAEAARFFASFRLQQ